MKLSHQVVDVEKGIVKLLFPKSFVIGVLASIYILAFVISPYWLIPESTSGRAGMLILTIFLGSLWCFFSAGELNIRIDTRHLWAIIPLVAGIIAINFQALKYDIPWQGDEGFHIIITLWVIDRISPNWTAAYYIFPIALVFFLFIAWKFPKQAGILGGLFLSAIILLLIQQDIFNNQADFYLRYPFVNYILFSILPILVSPKFPYHEILFRIFPFISVVGIAWITAKKSDFPGGGTTFLWGIAIATIPTVFYYSSVLYLELPAVLLMLIVALDIKNLLVNDFDLIKKSAGWFALILVGFIKETTLSFLLCFLFCRWMILIIRTVSYNYSPVKKSVRLFLVQFGRELLLAMCILAPLAFYLILRTDLTDGRSFNGDASNVLKFFIYPTLIKSFVEQFGAFFFLFLIGCGILLIRKEYSTALFYLFTFLFVPLFHVTDSIAYTGYSRFNLFILPVILAGGIVATSLLRQTRVLAVAASSILILSNVWISPVQADGSKQAYWGNYLVDTSEHYFPYQKALTWLKQNYYDSKILFISGDYSYNFEFYFNQLDWHPAGEFIEDNLFERGNEDVAIFRYLEQAEKGSFSAVLYQVVEENSIPPQKAGAYHLENIFINDAGQRLLVYVH